MIHDAGISFIVTMTRLRPIPSDRTRRLWRSVGFLFDKEEAIQAVKNNAGDIYEAGYYPLCVVETLGEGIYPNTISTAWFQWDKDKGGYQEIPERPDDLKQVVSFSMG
jgi:hypothetical protein